MSRRCDPSTHGRVLLTIFGLGAVCTAQPSQQSACTSETAWGASRGDPAAQMNLGLCLLEGSETFGQDRSASEVWMEKAARQRYAPAARQLGRMLQFRNREAADDLVLGDDGGGGWFDLACELSDGEACFQAARFRGQMRHDVAESVHWLERAVEAGHAQAAMNAAKFYADGANGLEQNLSRAAALAYRAGELGIEAGFQIAAQLAPSDTKPEPPSKEEPTAEEVYNLGKAKHGGGEWDVGVYFLQAAAEAGHAAAARELAEIMMQGETGGGRNCSEAVRLFEQAANAGDIKAQIRLAVLIQEGPPRGPALRDLSQATELAAAAKASGSNLASEVLRLLLQRTTHT